MTYQGTLHHGKLVTDPPIADDQPVRVEVTLMDEDDRTAGIRRATRPFDLNDAVSTRLRELLSKLPGSLSDDIIAERRGDEA
jgi:hypothetical protein